MRDPGLAEALRQVRVGDNFSFWGNFLAGTGEIRQFAGPGPLNTDDHPLVTFQAPRFVYGNPEPADRRLIRLVRSFHPQPAEIFAQSETLPEDHHRRLADYWAARNRFLEAGVGVKPTGDLRELLARVRKPLLEIVRQSRDFEAAYSPLLGMAQGLYRIDTAEGERLLLELEKANPYQDEARRLRERLSFLVPDSARSGM